MKSEVGIHVDLLKSDQNINISCFYLRTMGGSERLKVHPIMSHKAPSLNKILDMQWIQSSPNGLSWFIMVYPWFIQCLSWFIHGLSHSNPMISSASLVGIPALW